MIDAALLTKVHAMTAQAAGAVPFVHGATFGGNKPRYFIVGDMPTLRDVAVGRPFTGALGEVLTAAMETLREKLGAKPEDCYATYLIKAVEPGKLTEAKIVEIWLPIIQLERTASGCGSVVAIGKISRMFAGHVSVTPTGVRAGGPTFAEKAAEIWRIVRA